jgi:uncharacterized membrane protein YhaH (DUF805 family)
MGVGNIWQWEGRVDRGRYAAVGVVAFALKFLLDWLVVIRLFHRPWSLLNYWRPFGAISGVHGLSLENRLFAGVMLFLALPFIWLGLAMTVKRLRDAGEPSWLAALFFAPVANLLFFLALRFKPCTLVSMKRRAVARAGGSGCLDSRDAGGECDSEHRNHHGDRTWLDATGYAGCGDLRMGIICRFAILFGIVRGAHP